MTSHPPIKTQPLAVTQKRSLQVSLIGSCLVLLILSLSVLLGGYSGYLSGRQEIAKAEVLADFQLLQDQFFLGMKDYNEGNLDLARQRFEFILARDPNFPGATDRLVEILRILYATSTPTAIPPTATLTPTHDTRPVEDLFVAAVNYYNASEWNLAVDTLIALRKENPAYRVIEVDSLLFRILRNRGIQKIQAESNLEGGIYDLALAERFGPIDDEAMKWRNLARLYMIGLSFWEVYPEQAVYYFGQLALAAPYLRDASGWSASGRYRAALVQYADHLARLGDWCQAEAQYQNALSLGADERLQATVVNAQIQCAPPTSTPTTTSTNTLTPTITATTPAGTIIVTNTGTLTLPPVSQTPTPTIGLTVQPSETATPSFSPSPTYQSTATPTPTEMSPPTSTLTTSPTSSSAFDNTKVVNIFQGNNP